MNFTILPEELMDEIKSIFSDSEFTLKENESELKGKLYGANEDYNHNASLICDLKDVIIDFCEGYDIEYDCNVENVDTLEETDINFTYQESDFEVIIKVNEENDGFMYFSIAVE